MPDDPLIRLLLLAALLLFSGFFSGSETALLALDKLRVKYLVQKKRRGAKKLEQLLNHPDRLLSGILVGNNLVNIAASVFATGLLVQLYGERGEWLTIVLLTPVLLLFAEICPKTYAAKYPERVSFWVLRPISFVLCLLAPIIWLTTHFARFFTHLLKGESTEDGLLSEDEIRSIISVGEESGVVEAEQRRMLHGIFDLSETRVRDVMIPRTEVAGIEVSTPLSEVIDLVRRSRHSRFPVYEGSLDQVVGIIHAKDILTADCLQGFNLRERCRPPYFIPESKHIGALLQAFRRRRVHLGIVIDEYGGTEGVVTLEDILEEIVGEIHDEYDEQEIPVRRIGQYSYRVDAGISMKELNRRFGVKLPEEHAATLAGFLLHRFGGFPGEGDCCDAQGLRFRVCRMEDRRIEEVEMEMGPASVEEGD